MNKKKLIGTIIGVIMFGLLMAGATYAWLSFNATVVNAKYNAHTVNYWVNYTKGTDLSDMPILSGTPTTSNTLSTTLTAVKPTGSLVDHVNLHLTTTSSNALTTSNLGIINYAVCDGTCSGNLTAVSGNIVAIGKVQANTYTSGTTIDLYTDQISTALTGTDTFKYYIYFWIDAEPLVNDHLGLTYSGYLHASANQTDQEEK